MFVGLDGCKSGWVAVTLTATDVRAAVFSTLQEVMQAHTNATCIGIDMPVAMLQEGSRLADAAARAFLTGQASTVFGTPPLPALEAGSYAQAVALSQTLFGKGVSKQAFALAPKILEVQTFAHDPRVHEVHPEVSFRVLGGGPRLPSKKSWAGLSERVRLLSTAGIELPERFVGDDRTGVDDVVDAAVVAWSARRIACGEARRFPEVTDQRDGGGREVVIWA